MPYRIGFENDGRCAVLHFRGDVSGEELLAATREMYAADVRKRLRFQLVDMADATSLDISDEQVRAIAQLDQRAAAANPGQVVALVGRDELFVGADQQYAIYAEVWAGFRSQQFATVAAARAWFATLGSVPPADE